MTDDTTTTESNGDRSTVNDRDALAADLDTLDEQLGEVGEIDSVWRLQERVQASVALAKKALDTVNRYENRLDELQSEVDRLQDEVDRLRDGQRLIDATEEALANDADARVAIILQTLHNEAQENATDRARMTAREAWSTVNRSVHRSQIYDTLRRAETVVDDVDVCDFVERPRGADPPSHLRVDLTEGDLPARIGGRKVRSGGTDDV